MGLLSASAPADQLPDSKLDQFAFADPAPLLALSIEAEVFQLIVGMPGQLAEEMVVTLFSVGVHRCSLIPLHTLD
jgi:hypothetical protein